MHRFFVDSSQIDGVNNTIEITGEDVRHIAKVLRLKEGEEIEVCDGEGMEYIATIEEIGGDRVNTLIRETYRSKRESPLEIVLYQGLPKSSKMDLIIQKCTELGIHRIIPIRTKRSIVKIENAKAEKKKIDRWQRIAYEAAKQSKRGRIPVVDRVRDFEEIWSEISKNDLNIIAYEGEEQMGIKKILQENKDNIKRIGIIIGPEGGFEEEEIQKAKERDVFSITLGPRILRTETAGFVTLTILMYALGDIGGE